MPGWLPVVFAILSVLPAGVGVWVALLRSRKLRRMRAVESAPLPTDACIACGSANGELIAPQVLRCVVCGFVGGEGVAAWQRARFAAQVEHLPVGARQDLAREKLNEACLDLASAEELLKLAWRASWFDLFGLSWDRGEEKQSRWSGGLMHMRTAQQLMLESAQLLHAASAKAERGSVLDESALLAALDTGWLTDGVWVDVAVHRRIKRARAQLREMSVQADALRVQSDLPAQP